jgi:hypothetical protein
VLAVVVQTTLTLIKTTAVDAAVLAVVAIIALITVVLTVLTQQFITAHITLDTLVQTLALVVVEALTTTAHLVAMAVLELS